MPAGMHHSYFTSTVIFGAYFAGVRKAGLLLHRKRVEFGPQHHGRAGAVLHDANYACASHVLRYLITKRAQLACQRGGSPSLMRRDLRMLMQIQIQRMSVSKDGIYLAAEVGILRAGNSDEE